VETIVLAFLLTVATPGSVATSGKVNAFVAVENLFNTEYDVGRTPVLTAGLPRAVRAGVLVWLR
jgi:hypothetical protein